VNGVVLPAGVRAVFSNTHLVIDVGMVERRSRRKRKVRLVVMVVVAVAGAGWQRAVEDQLEPCSCPAHKGHPQLDQFGVDQC